MKIADTLFRLIGALRMKTFKDWLQLSGAILSSPMNGHSRDNQIYRKIFNRLLSLTLTRVYLFYIYFLAELLTKHPKRGEDEMNILMRILLVFTLMIVAAPTYAAEATQMWRCEMNDGTTEEEVMTIAQEWLKAARKLGGGERLEAQVLFPVAVNATGQMDVMFIITAPTFEEWGKFWDNFIVSPDAAAAAKRNQEKIICPDSLLWESIKIK
jgi:hypothetical protein